MFKLNKEAVDEITYLLDEVKDVVKLLKEFGIYINSDTWSATYPINHDYENILSWNKKNFETIDVSDIKSFSIGGNLITGSQHQYKNIWVLAPKQLAKVQGEIFKNYLESIIDSISLKHFKLELNEPYGLTDNCGWEHYIEINTIIKKSALIEEKKYIEDKTIEKLNKYELLIFASEHFTQLLYYLNDNENVKNKEIKIGQIKYDGWKADLYCELNDEQVLFKHIRDFDKKTFKANSLTEQLIYAWGFENEMEIDIDFDIINNFYKNLNQEKKYIYDELYDEAHCNFW